MLYNLISILLLASNLSLGQAKVLYHNHDSHFLNTTNSTAGAQPEVPSGYTPVFPSGSKPEVPSVSQPVYPSGTMIVVPSGSKPEIPSGSKPEIPSGSKPEVSSGSNPEVPSESNSGDVLSEKPGSNSNSNSDSEYHRDDDAIRQALTYDEMKSSVKHKGQDYTYNATNLEQWKDEMFPEAEIKIDLVWNVTHDYYAPDGEYISGFFINGQTPGPAIIANENDWIRVVVNNYLPVPMTVHFHGIDQAYTPWSDGMPGVTQYPILSGGTYAYIFQFKNQHGAFWYHAHYRAYSQDGIMGPIYIVPAPHVSRPYSQIEGISQEDAAYIQNTLEKNPTNVIVHDGYSHVSDDILVRLYRDNIIPTCAQSVLVNGKGRVTCHSAEDISKASGIRGNIGFEGPLTYDEMGCAGGFPVESIQKAKALGVSGYLKCSATDSDREIIYTNGQKYIFMNIYNMAAETEKVFSIDEHDLIVLAVDGMFVEPEVVQQINLPIATRYTILVKAKEGVKDGAAFGFRFASTEVFQVLEGFALFVYGNSTGHESYYQALDDAPSQRIQDIGGSLISNDSKRIEFEELTPLGDYYAPKEGPADHTINLLLNSTGGVHFSIFKSQTLFMPGAELDAPYLLQTDPSKLDFANIPAAIDTGIKLGDVVDLVVDNTVLLDHPFHIHGHSFSLISKSKTENFQYSDVAEALRRDPSSIDFKGSAFVDSVNVPKGGHVVIRFTAHNPGYWFLHCHINHHLAAGMGGFIVIDPERIPPIPFVLYSQPHVEYDSSVEINISEPYGEK